MGKTTKNYTLTTDPDCKIKVVCKECSRETTHAVIANYVEAGSEEVEPPHTVDWNVNNQIIQCLGCEEVSFRNSWTCSEDYDLGPEGVYYNEHEKLYPSRSEGLKGINIYLLPQNVQGIYQETILAIESEQNVLAGIGIRSLIETICKDQDATGSNLYEKINSLLDTSIVTRDGAETLHKLRVLGNDAAHEVRAHSIDQLQLAISIVEHMLDGTYIIPHKVNQTFK